MEIRKCIGRPLKNRHDVLVIAIGFSLPLACLYALAFADPQFPCKGIEGEWLPCGENAPDSPYEEDVGSCQYFVGVGCSNMVNNCKDNSDYLCRTDDQCGSTNQESQCSTANYATWTARWYLTCRTDFDPEYECACVVKLNMDDLFPITYKTFVGGSQACP